MLTIKPVDFTSELNYIKETLIPEAVESTNTNRKDIRKNRLTFSFALPVLLLCVGYWVFLFNYFLDSLNARPSGWILVGHITLAVLTLIIGCISAFVLQETTYIPKKREQEEYDFYQNSLNKISNAQTLEDAKKRVG